MINHRETDLELDQRIVGGIVLQADLNKCKIFDWKKRSTDRDGRKRSIGEVKTQDCRPRQEEGEVYK